MYEHRLEENTATKENLLLREREQNDATTKAQSESQERSEQLLKKFLDVDRKIDLLQDTIERHFIFLVLNIYICMLGSPFFSFYEMLVFDTHFFNIIQAWRKFNNKGYFVAIREAREGCN
jgi:hypothetical protein